MGAIAVSRPSKRPNTFNVAHLFRLRSLFLMPQSYDCLGRARTAYKQAEHTSCRVREHSVPV